MTLDRSAHWLAISQEGKVRQTRTAQGQLGFIDAGTVKGVDSFGPTLLISRHIQWRPVAEDALRQGVDCACLGLSVGRLGVGSRRFTVRKIGSHD
jgi:hypothetical protein